MTTPVYDTDPQHYQITPEDDPLFWLEVDSTASPPQAAPVYLMFDPRDDNEPLWVETGYSDGNTPEAVWNGCVRRYLLPAGVSAVALTTAINEGEFDALLGRIDAGYETHWDGSSRRGILSEDARQAEYALEHQLDGFADTMPEFAGVWDVHDWFAPMSLDDWRETGLRADLTDAEVADLADRLEQEARQEGALMDGIEDYLLAKRNELRASADAR